MLLVVKSFSTCRARLARQELRRPDAIPWDAEEGANDSVHYPGGLQ